LLSEGFKQKLTLEAIGLECGFGSRTNFYNAFKKVTGKTPSEYLDACKITIITADNLEIIPEKYNTAPSEEVAEAF
jgi:AraC-like DNA-binding protein